MCVLGRLGASKEAVCDKASLALTRGPSARAGGMKLKFSIEGKKKRERKKSDRGGGGRGGGVGGVGETKDNRDAGEDRT